MESVGKNYLQINSTFDLVVTVVWICNEAPSLSFGEGKRSDDKCLTPTKASEVRPLLGR